MMRNIMLLSAVLFSMGSQGNAAEPSRWMTQTACEAATHRECVINSAKQWMPSADKAAKPAPKAAAAAVSAAKTAKTAPAETAKASGQKPAEQKKTEQSKPEQKTPEQEVAAPMPAASQEPPPQPAPVEPPPSAPVQAQEQGGFFTKLFGMGKGGKSSNAASASPVSPSVPVVAPPPSLPRPIAAAPEPRERTEAEKEQFLRGQVWTSESACKKEALKGSCSSVDCATHTGGVCSGFTSMVWIYR